MSKKDTGEKKIVAQNRKARFNYHIEDVMEAGIILTGTEVKSLRTGAANITDSHAGLKEGEFYLFNLYIPEYAKSHIKWQHDVRRPRKLLLHKHQMQKLIGAIQRKGMAMVPLSIYFTPRGVAKVELALASGKKKHDKRETEKKRDWQRDKARIMRDKG